MIILDDLEQGATEWLIARLAVITASRAAEFSQPPSLAPMPDVEIVKDGKINRCEFNGQVFEHSNKIELAKLVRASLPPVYSDMRNGYMNELIGQVCTGEIKEQVKFKQAEWGHENEPVARSIFEFKKGVEVKEVGFIYKDDHKRAGISPDGILVGIDEGLELKCPFDTRVYIDFVLNGKVKPEYIEQCQFSMWVTGFKKWHFGCYDPRMRKSNFHSIEFDRDESFMKKYDDAYEVFIKEMDEKLNKLGFEFSDIYTK